jgi:ElaB/YqjD/DUF883 family membrane-anchored ribosome-binding protein
VPPRAGRPLRGHDRQAGRGVGDRAPDLKQKLVQEFDEVTQKDMDDASDDPDDIVDRVQKKTGQPREQVEQRVTQVMERS